MCQGGDRVDEESIVPGSQTTRSAPDARVGKTAVFPGWLHSTRRTEPRAVVSIIWGRRGRANWAQAEAARRHAAVLVRG
jgi:hypothetical protein